MRASAMAVRDYTTSSPQPLLTHCSRANARFHPEWVPAFGATTAFSKLRQHFPEYDSFLPSE
jgi:hypothetical protein